jgi:putative ATP-binding cassette transporter
MKVDRQSQRIQFFSFLKLITLPFFLSEARKKAFLLLFTLFGFLVGVSIINVKLSYLGRDFITALSERKLDSFWAILPLYVTGLAAATLISVFYRVTEERLALSWRKWMTQYLLKRYFYKRNYYKLLSLGELDNPDQRIAEDVKNFTSTTLSLILILINSAVTVAAFIGVLSAISWALVGVLIAYSVTGTFLSYVVGKKLIRLHNRQYRFEANFRYGLIRVRDNSESIAFFRGEPRERIDLSKKFGAAANNTYSLINWNRNLGFLTTGYNYLALLIPTIIVAPLYISKQVEFGVITQAQGAFAQVLAALSVIMTQFERISAYAAAVSRVGKLWQVLVGDGLPTEEDDDPVVEILEGDRLRLKALTVNPPQSKRDLIKEVTLTLGAGKGILIMGPSGSGKSSILRTIAGLWNSGGGTIERPKLSDMIFLPQKPYMPPGNLRAQILYPKRADTSRVTDEELREVLKAVNLEEVLKRVNNSFDVKLDWGNILSLGEQQRLSFARLLIRKPILAFLDEATSALDEENESLLYTQVRALGVSIISVGHRSTLRQYHDKVLLLSGDGGWELGNNELGKTD